MKHLLFALLFFTACRDQFQQEYPRRDAAEIEGLWYNEPQPLIPKTWFWHFSDGQLHKQTFDFGQQIVEHWYGYETRADTVFLREMLEPDDCEVFTVVFETDSTAALTMHPIHITYKLKRF